MFILVPAGLSFGNTRYLCTGQGDQATFQAATDALPAEGGTLTLLPGTYCLTTPLDLTNKPLILQGSGLQSTRLEFTFAAPDSCIKLGGAPSLPRVVIRDLSIIGDAMFTNNGIWLRDHSAYHTFHNLLIQDMVQAGVRGQSNSQNVFDAVHVLNSAGFGFKMYGVANRYIGCIASRNSEVGLGGLAAFRSHEMGSSYSGCIADDHDIGFELAGYATGVSVHGLHAERCNRGIVIGASEPNQPQGVSFYGGVIVNAQHTTLAAIDVKRVDGITLAGLCISGSTSGKSISVAEPVTACMLLNNRSKDAVPYDIHPDADVTII